MASISGYYDHDNHAIVILVTTRQRLLHEFLTHSAWLNFLKMYASVVYINVRFSEESILAIHWIFTKVYAPLKNVRDHYTTW